MTDDDAFDRDLAAVLAAEPADPAPVSQAVLTRLVATATPNRRGLAEVLVSPYPLAVTLAGTLLLAGAASYAALPRLMGDDLSALVVLGDLLHPGGGF